MGIYKVYYNDEIVHSKYLQHYQSDWAYDKNINYLLSQYYAGSVILLILNIAVALLLVFIIFGVPIGFSSQTAVDSVVILQYILYFLTTLVVVPTLIELWPRSYATSVRIEEVLNLEDKIVKKYNISWNFICNNRF